VFWDASALVPIMLDEPTSAPLVEMFDADAQPAIWWATPVESYSAIARGVRDGRITKGEATNATERLRAVRRELREVPPNDGLRARAMRLLSVHRLRAADALQLAAALVWSEEEPVGEHFVSLGTHLRDAARREGFTLLPPD
jgi:predicted nucleic acid-binding protein